MRFRTAFTKDETGFTVTELLVTITASLIVLAALGAIFTIQNRSYSAQERIVVAQENARAALQLMTKELLMAGYDPTGNADAGIEIADADVVQFTWDKNGNGVVDTTGSERIKYTLDTTAKQVRRTVGSGTPQPIGENIQSLSFSYYDSDGNQLTGVPLSDAQKARVTRVVVHVTPDLSQAAGSDGNAGEGSIVLWAYDGAVRAWESVSELLTPPAYATGDRELRDGVTPPNLGKRRTGADTGGGSGSGIGPSGTGYQTVKDDTWSESSSSSSSSSS